MVIRGYKAFNNDMSNRYGMHFEEGKEYSVSGPVLFGNKGNGFHFCKRLEDTLRYVDAMNDDIKIAEVIGSGDIVESYDDYYGYYDMYVASDLKIVRVLDRDEIIEMYLNMPEYRVERFAMGYKLDDNEIVKFKLKYLDATRVLQAIAYYQEGDKDAYSIDRVFQFMKLKKRS